MIKTKKDTLGILPALELGANAVAAMGQLVSLFLLLFRII